MIVYLSQPGHGITLKTFLDDWGEPLRGKVHFGSYQRPGRDAGALICTDLERTPDMKPRAVAVAAELSSRYLKHTGTALPVLNNPRHTMTRRALLRLLFEKGINTFRAFAPDELPADLRFPVFVREAREHTGSLSGLLKTRTELHQKLRWLAERRPTTPLLVVEYVDVWQGGAFRKYSVFRIGDRFINHHIMFRTAEWMVKGPSLAEPWMVDEERRFQLLNPHAALIKEVFEFAQVDYGRIDYGIDRGGRVQIWEINTNPLLLYPKHKYQEHQLQNKRWFAAQANKGLLTLLGTQKATADV